MSGQFTSEWLRQREAKTQAKQAALIPTSEDTERELHDQIMSWCRRQDPEVPCGHADPTKKSRYTEGWADFTLLLPGGKPLLIECKVGGNTLSPEQEDFKYKAERVGYTVHICGSYNQFLGIVNETLKL